MTFDSLKNVMMHHPLQPVYDTRPLPQGHERDVGGNFPGAWSRLCVLVLLFSYLFATALAAAESWHHAFHEDEGSHEHQCLVTQLQSGQFAANGASQMPLILPARRCAEVSFESSTFVPCLLPGLRHGRDPPV